MRRKLLRKEQEVQLNVREGGARKRSSEVMEML